MEYSIKQLKKAKDCSFEHNDNTPLVVPADCTQPETYNEAIARILHHSGVIDDGAYQKLRGFDYDGDFSDDEDFAGDWDDDDEFEQSSFAEYEQPLDATTDFAEAPAPHQQNIRKSEGAEAPSDSSEPDSGSALEAESLSASADKAQ